MTLIGTFRRISKPLTRAVVVLFALAWLGLAAQPCMAVGAHDSGTPVPQMPLGDGHGCPHCPPPASDSRDCADAVALDCVATGEPALMSRGVKAQDQSPDIALPTVLPPAANAGSSLKAPTVPRGPGGHVAPRSVQQRYCTYLK